MDWRTESLVMSIVLSPLALAVWWLNLTTATVCTSSVFLPFCLHVQVRWWCSRWTCAPPLLCAQVHHAVVNFEEFDDWTSTPQCAQVQPQYTFIEHGMQGNAIESSSWKLAKKTSTLVSLWIGCGYFSFNPLYINTFNRRQSFSQAAHYYEVWPEGRSSWENIIMAFNISSNEHSSG